ncbi:NEDD8-activating enzyme E1 regulatory subunit AXR1-like isoform X4 [Brassica napus]|uniref:NEDD8-activating enzyme E1 regulatory subunit AXR1-like isoform X4 n=1 Tax=Brassica napus TaxID=3708 RepID=UPI0006AAB216|nr:NEDD8-activating enzyme E1 regulatory subunit AXR1-like isoform X4 [Brassica napus]
MLSPRRNLSSMESVGVSLGGIQIYFSLCINSIARRIGSRSNQSLEHGWIWGKVGRAGLEEASICLLNCGPTGSEALKNLVLGGVGSITIVDGSKVELGDLGNNFMGAHYN